MALETESPSVPLSLRESEASFRHASEREPLLPIEFLVCDLDGTLVDVGAKHRRAFVNGVHKGFGISREAAWTHYYGVAGRRTPHQVHSLLDKLHMDTEPELTERVIEQIQEKKSRAFGDAFTEAPGMLYGVRNDRVKLAVSTFAREKDAIAKLRYAEILDYFILPEDRQEVTGKIYAVVGKDSLGTNILQKGKPHFEYIAWLYGKPYSEFERAGSFITDTVEDLDEARLTRMRLIGVSDYAHTRIELLDAHANVVRNPREYGHIRSILRSL